MKKDATHKNITHEWTFEEIIRLYTSEVSPQAIAALRRACNPWRCVKGEQIVRQGEKCDRWIFIAKGLASIVYKKGTKSTTLFLGGASCVFTSFHSYMANKGSIFDVEALTDCYGWEIEHDIYKDLVKKYPDLLHFELNYMRIQLYELEVKYERWALSSPLERYRMLWNQYPEMLSSDPLYGSDMTQHVPLKVIASYLGMTQQTLSKIRRKELDSLRNGKKENP